ncbi:MAG: GDP-L-fucose synthase [Flavobacteriales bacterium]|nr:GDP-L-fucose synthase [Flavobacteriales bacterium]
MASLDKHAPIYVAGHRGMVGSAIVRALKKAGHENLLLKTSKELDLRDQKAVMSFLAQAQPRHVYLAAAKVGGIHANNTLRGDFLYDNLIMQANVIEGSRRAGVEKLLFLGSSCIYPKHAPQPMREDALLTGELEPTNEPYAIAKIAGLIMCDAYSHQHGCNFISAMPTNLYGPGDNYHPEHSHVLPAMIRRFHEAKMEGAKEVVCWGTGTPKREFLHVDDLAQACLFLMDQHHAAGWVNVGTGADLSIQDLALLVAQTVGYEGTVSWDHSRPDGTPRKLLDVSLMSELGWNASISLKEGMVEVYEEFKKSLEMETMRG